MSYYYWSNKKELLKKAHDKYHNKGGNKELLNIIKKTMK